MGQVWESSSDGNLRSRSRFYLCGDGDGNGNDFEDGDRDGKTIPKPDPPHYHP